MVTRDAEVCQQGRGKIHIACGQRLIYADIGLGRVGYISPVRKVFYPKSKVKGGSYPMAFDKNVPYAGDVAKAGRGETIGTYEGVKLQLNSYTTKPSKSFGQISVLECRTEDGDLVRLSTFSEVVAGQLDEIKEDIPCIITPRKVSNYYTIY